MVKNKVKFLRYENLFPSITGRSFESQSADMRGSWPAAALTFLNSTTALNISSSSKSVECHGTAFKNSFGLIPQTLFWLGINGQSEKWRSAIGAHHPLGAQPFARRR